MSPSPFPPYLFAYTHSLARSRFVALFAFLLLATVHSNYSLVFMYTVATTVAAATAFLCIFDCFFFIENSTENRFYRNENIVDCNKREQPKRWGKTSSAIQNFCSIHSVSSSPILFSFYYTAAACCCCFYRLYAPVFDSHLFILNLIHPFEHENWAGRSKDRRTCMRVFLCVCMCACGIFFNLYPTVCMLGKCI